MRNKFMASTYLLSRVYNNKYTKYAQIAAPAAARLALNVYTGQSLANGMPVAAVLCIVSYTTPKRSDAKFKTLYTLLLDPMKHQLVSCLLNSVLSSFGFDKHITEFAAKACATFVYGSKFGENALDGAFSGCLISDATKCFLSYMGLYSLLGDNYGAPYLMSFLSQVAIGGVYEFITKGKKVDALVPAVASVMAFPAAWLIPMEGESPIVSYMPQFVESLTSFISGAVSAFTESGISI